MSETPSMDDTSPKPEVETTPPVVLRWPFGPVFFSNQLRGFIRDHCPDPTEHLPSVQIHLRDGSSLEVCHISGLAPLWVALAVWEDDGTAMRTELIPYDAMARVVVRSTEAKRQGGKRIGFDATHTPPLLHGSEGTPEYLLAAARALPKEME